MKTFLIIIAFLLSHLLIYPQYPRYQKISAAEYFIDTDPGPGNGTPITGSLGYWEVELNVPNITTSIGSTIYIRVKSTNGSWSSPRSIKRNEYFVNKNALLQYGEYFINSDPGKGNGTQISFDDGNSYIKNLKLKKGDRIFVRVRDSFNRWSTSRPVTFHYKEMLSAEYYIKLNLGGSTAPDLMNTGQISDSSCVFIATKNDVPWHDRDTVFVRFTTTDRFIGKWTKGPLIDPTDAEEHDNQIPGAFALFQNYPNPFNPTTTLSYQLPVISKISLKIYDILGKEVATLVDQEQEAGYYDIKFNASLLSSGVYFYRLQTDSFVETKKLILLK